MNDATGCTAAGVLRLKESTGWFAAGASFRRALGTLSAGAFQLFAYICLYAERRSGRYEARHAELAEALGKSRRIVGGYIRELEAKGVCAVGRGANQYARSFFTVCEDYWPYHRDQDAGAGHAGAYVRSVERSFVSLGCTTGRFSGRDAQLARDLETSGVPLATVEDALLLGGARKYVSWLDGRAPEPIASLAYFKAVVSEVQERPLPADYREYLKRKIAEFAREWARRSKEAIDGGPSDADGPESDT